MLKLSKLYYINFVFKDLYWCRLSYEEELFLTREKVEEKLIFPLGKYSLMISTLSLTILKCMRGF